ncbi:MAG TPA: hypothetical protein VFJ52_04560 [Terriglobia bacterium]|nr:hypothetical protein [Terriglobia bacterium]
MNLIFAADGSTPDGLAIWLQLVLQTGALGLLAAVIRLAPPWIKKILDDQVSERTALYTGLVNQINNDHQARNQLAMHFEKSLNQLSRDWRDEAQKDRDAFYQRYEGLKGALQEHSQELRALVEELKNMPVHSHEGH